MVTDLMRWMVFFIFMYLFLLIQVGLGDLLAYGDDATVPNLLLILAVFVGITCHRSA